MNTLLKRLICEAQFYRDPTGRERVTIPAKIYRRANAGYYSEGSVKMYQSESGGMVDMSSSAYYCIKAALERKPWWKRILGL